MARLKIHFAGRRAVCKVLWRPSHQAVWMGVPTDEITLAETVRACRAGDPAARERLARRACRLALRTSSAILHSDEYARDVAQDVAVDVLRSVDGLRDPEAFDAWVHRITVRHALRAARSRRARALAEAELDAVALDGVSLTGAPARSLAGDLSADADLRLAARDALTRGLATLPSRQRAALALRYVHDLPDAEIANALGCRVGTVHALLSRGRAALRADPGLIDLVQTMTGDG